MVVEIRLYLDADCKKECTFLEYKRLKINLRDTCKHFLKTVDDRGPRHGEKKHCFINTKFFGYSIKPKTPIEDVIALAIYINNKFICKNTLTSVFTIDKFHDMGFHPGDFELELMKEDYELLI